MAGGLNTLSHSGKTRARMLPGPWRLAVAPGPTASIAVISWELGNGEGLIVLHNATGHVVRYVNVGNDETRITLDLTIEEAGVHFMEVRSAHGES